MDLIPLPQECLQGAHARPSLRAAGVRRRELEGPLWRPAGHGRHAWALTDPREPWQRILEVASVLPEGAAITGWAALFAHGARDLDGIGRRDGLLPVPVAMQFQEQVRRGPGIRPLRSALADDDLTTVDTVPVTVRERAWFDHARLRGVEEGLVGLDAALRSCHLELPAAVAYAAARPRWKGVRAVRQALGLADARARSCPESRLRFVWMVEAGLPRPEVNVEVRHEGGWLLGLPDLLHPGSGFVGEYDGAQHRELVQHSDDNAREEAFEAAGLTVARATSVDLGQRRAALVHRLREGYAHAQAKQPSTRRWYLPSGHSGRH